MKHRKRKGFPRRVRIDVEQEHIDTAEARSCTRCIAVLSIKKSIPNARYVHAELNFVSLNREGHTHREQGRLPPQMNHALILLDEEKRDQIKPFSFWLNLTPTSKIMRPTPERQARVQELRKKRAAAGHREKKHRIPIRRVSGAAVSALMREYIGAPGPVTRREAVERLSQIEKWEITHGRHHSTA